MHPCYYSCPLKYLDMAQDGVCEAWRENVRAWHAQRKRKLVVGRTYAIQGCSVPHITITQLRPLRGTYGSVRYRLSRKYIGAELPSAAAPQSTTTK